MFCLSLCPASICSSSFSFCCLFFLFLLLAVVVVVVFFLLLFARFSVVVFFCCCCWFSFLLLHMNTMNHPNRHHFSYKWTFLFTMETYWTRYLNDIKCIYIWTVWKKTKKKHDKQKTVSMQTSATRKIGHMELWFVQIALNELIRTWTWHLILNIYIYHGRETQQHCLHISCGNVFVKSFKCHAILRTTECACFYVQQISSDSALYDFCFSVDFICTVDNDSELRLNDTWIKPIKLHAKL